MNRHKFKMNSCQRNIINEDMICNGYFQWTWTGVVIIIGNTQMRILQKIILWTDEALKCDRGRC